MIIDQDEQTRLLQEVTRAADRNDAPGMMVAADQVLRNDPRSAQAIFVAAVSHMRMGHDGIALQLLNVAGQLAPQVHAIWHNMARCLVDRNPPEAYKALLRAQQCAPDDPDTLVSLANTASQLGRHAEALEYWETHKRLHGFAKEGAHNAAFALLHLGRWDEAWKLYKGSLGGEDRVALNYHEDRETPRWDPRKHEGGVVVLYGEQAIGDEIMFASLVPRAIEAANAKGTRLIIECLPRNAGLFRRSFEPFGVDVFGTRFKNRDWPELEGVTHRLEFGGLGEFFAPEPFRGHAYLEADRTRRAMWKLFLDREGREGKPKVGIAWTGGSWKTGRHRRSIPFHQIALLLQRFGGEVDFVNLEYEDRVDDLEMVRAPVLNPAYATKKGADYDDTAALVAELDLVIAPTTSVVDLAGALGVECWALADQHPQWRYSDAAGADEMFFYAGVRVFRQQTWGDWAPTLEALAERLRDWVEDFNLLAQHRADGLEAEFEATLANGAAQ